MNTRLFKLADFFNALDQTRTYRRKNWRAVSKESGVHISILVRMSQGHCPIVDYITALAQWANISVEKYHGVG